MTTDEDHGSLLEDCKHVWPEWLGEGGERREQGPLLQVFNKRELVLFLQRGEPCCKQ